MISSLFEKRFLKYLLVGGMNTVFGYGVYALFVWILAGKFAASYMVASIVSQIAGVTFSYATYKIFVFKTKGNVWAEYLKCWSVYGAASLICVAVLPVFVIGFEWILPTDFQKYAPYLGGLSVTGITVLFSFFGHSKITFRQTGQ